MSGVTHVWTTKIAAPGLPSLPGDAAVTVTGNSSVEIEEDVAPSSTITIAVGTVTAANLRSLVINGTAALTANTNVAGGASPGQSIVLSAGKSYAWNNTLDSTAFPNPISFNITKLFAINAGATTATLRASLLANN